MSGMDFSNAINSIMQHVKDGSSEPFIIYRDTRGGWHCDSTQNQYGETFEWVEGAKEQDPCALVFTGKDFSDGSYPYAYYAVLGNRVYLESFIDFFSGRDSSQINALANFFRDNVGGFSHEATDYLATLERPLSALAEMCPFNMATDHEGWSYNESLTADAIEYIECEVKDRLRPVSKNMVLTSEHCLENSNGDDFTGKLLIVKADALIPEYRDSLSQIVKCTHGNGARPNAIGQSIFCKELASKMTAVYYRHEIEGIADIGKLPHWAKQMLVAQEKQGRQKAANPKPDKKPSLLGRLDEAKAEADAHNAARKDLPKTKKRGDMEVS